MSTPRDRTSRKAAGGRKRETVGGTESSGGWNTLFNFGIVAVVLSAIVLVTVAADSVFGGGKPSSPAGPGATATSDGATTGPFQTPTPGTNAPTATPEATPGLEGTILVACGDILAPLDKQHRLPRDCAPGDLKQVAGGTFLRAEAANALTELFAAGGQLGYTLYANSAYRSYDEQASTYQYWVSVSGQAYADRTSARAGHSEHQLGTTADIGARGLELEAFGGTPEAAWLAANAYRYGFVVSYPDGKEQVTGYAPEPWHIRYVGKDTAQKVKDSGLTLHEYLLR